MWFTARSKRPIDILSGIGKAVRRQKNDPCQKRLQEPSARIISESPDHPKKKPRQDQMKEREHANEYGVVGVEHIIG